MTERLGDMGGETRDRLDCADILDHANSIPGTSDSKVGQFVRDRLTELLKTAAQDIIEEEDQEF